MSEKDKVTYGSLVSGYMFHGFVDTMDVFRDSKKPKSSSWNAVISGLVQNNQHEDALDLIREMQACGCKPNTVTLSSTLPTISLFSNLKVGKEVHTYAVKNNFDWNIYVATAIIDTYAKSGFLNGAQRVFDQAKSKSLIIWTSIISAYASHGDADTSLSLFYEMLNSGIQPDQVTFTAVLTACSHSGVVDKAWKIFDTIFPNMAFFPQLSIMLAWEVFLAELGNSAKLQTLSTKCQLSQVLKFGAHYLMGHQFLVTLSWESLSLIACFKSSPRIQGTTSLWQICIHKLGDGKKLIRSRRE